MKLLKDKTVIITGATSGIGKACAFAFAREGCNLILTGRRENRLKELKDILESEHKVKIYILKMDVRNYEDVCNSFNSLPEEFKNIDILINNAGLARGLSKVYEGDPEQWNEMIDTNIKGLLYVTRNILPVMIKKNEGHIINIGSVAGHDVYTNGNVYCATKFAVNALSQSIRLDVLDKNIRVSTVDPGMVLTEFSLVRFSGDDQKAKNVYNGVDPLTPEDIAETIVFCASRPKHVNINEIIITPVQQANATTIYRK